MNASFFLARCAPIAIAIAALPATPALAQDAAATSPAQAPVIVLDPVPTSAPVTITLPNEAAPAPSTTAEPVVSTTTVAAEPAPAVRSIPRRNSEEARAPSPTQVAAPLRTETATPTSAPLTPAEGVVPVDSAPAAPLAAEAVAPAPVEDGSSQALLFGLLGALGIGVLGFLALRRRRRPSADSVPTIERPIIERDKSAAPAVAISALDRDPRVTSHDAPAFAASASSGRSVPNTPLPAHGAAVALPTAMPRTYAERDALLRRMVDAKPDRANPFQSPKARARRARLIMQSLGRSFANRKPRFDLSQYTSNWPALRGWQPATA